MGSPDLDSCTALPDSWDKRLARICVKTGGICCAIRIGTERFALRLEKKTSRAAGPPVEDAIKIKSGGDSNRDFSTNDLSRAKSLLS